MKIESLQGKVRELNKIKLNIRENSEKNKKERKHDVLFSEGQAGDIMTTPYLEHIFERDDLIIALKLESKKFSFTPNDKK